MPKASEYLGKKPKKKGADYLAEKAEDYKPPWYTPAMFGVGATMENLSNIGRRMVGSPESHTLQTIDAALRPSQTTGQNIMAGVAGFAPYAVPVAGQAAFAADVLSQPKEIPEMLKGIAETSTTAKEAFYGKGLGGAVANIFNPWSRGDPEAQEQVRQHPIEMAINQMLMIAGPKLIKAGVKKGVEVGKGVKAAKSIAKEAGQQLGEKFPESVKPEPPPNLIDQVLKWNEPKGKGVTDALQGKAKAEKLVKTKAPAKVEAKAEKVDSGVSGMPKRKQLPPDYIILADLPKEFKTHSRMTELQKDKVNIKQQNWLIQRKKELRTELGIDKTKGPIRYLDTKLPEHKGEVPKKPPIPKIETPKQAIVEIIEGKQESKIGTAEFKKRMLAELDKAIEKAPEVNPEFALPIEIHIPGDGDFRISNVKSDLRAVATKVRGLKEKQGRYPLLWQSAEDRRYVDPFSIYKGKKGALQEHIKSGDVKFIPAKRSGVVPPKPVIPPKITAPVKPPPKPPIPVSPPQPPPKPPKPIAISGAAGQPLAQHKVKTRMAPPVSRQEIVDYVRDNFKIPVRVGKFREKAIGIYKGPQEVIRTRIANDINTISHELGHHLAKIMVKASGSDKFSKLIFSPKANAELIKLGKDLYGTRKPKGGYRSEGFAEFISHWLTTEEAPNVAPEFYKYFKSQFLKNNPEIAGYLNNVRTLAREYYNQGAIARVRSNIGVNRPTFGRIKEKIRDIGLRANTLLADDLAPLEFAEKQIRGVSKLDPRKIDPMTSPTMLARANARTASSKARSMVTHGVFDKAGKQTGKSMRDALAPVAKDLDNAMTYSYAKRALEVHAQGKDPGITRRDAQYVVDNIGDPARRQAYKQTHKDLTAFENGVMDYLVESGGMSKDAAQIIMDLNPSHIPLKRVIDNSFTGTGGKKVVDIASPIKRLKGSGLPIQNPFESIIENTTAIINFADKVRVGKALIELSEKGGAGKWIEKIPAPIEAKKVSLESMKKQLKDAGVDLSKANMDEVLTVYSNAGLYRGRDNIVSFWRDGKREFYQVDERLYGTLKAMDDLHLPPIADFFFGRPARAIRLGATGLNAGFGLITNPLRDAFTFGLQTEYTSGMPGLIGKHLVKKVFKPNDNMNQLFRRSGADMSQFLGMDRKNLKMAISEATATTATRQAWNVVNHPIEAMKSVFSITEAAPRLAEFEGAYRAGEKLYGKGSPQAQIMANLAASDVTVNFRRAGAYGKFINQIIPFWNAQVQGVGKFGRFARDHPTKAMAKAAATLTIPTVGIWMLNKDEEWYRNSPPWMRYGFWNIPVGKNKDGSPAIVRIPRPFEWGIAFSGTPEMVLDYWYSKDPAVIKDGLSYMAEQTIPIGPNHIPPTIKIPIETWSNYDFFRERAIVPYYEGKYKEPEDQFSPYTTESAKFIGRQFGMSPRKIDHIVSSATGGLGRDITKATEKMLGFGKPETDHPANMPVIGRLFARTRTSEKIAQGRYYDRNDKLQRIKNKIRSGKHDEAKKMIAEWNRLNAGKMVLHKGKSKAAEVPSYEELLIKVQKK